MPRITEEVRMKTGRIKYGFAAALGVLTLAVAGCGKQDQQSSGPWQPTKTVEFIVPAGTGGGADKMAGTGSRQEDQIITASIEQKTGVKFTYIPFKGGGDVAVQLVGKHADSTVNNPIEAVAHWRGGKLRPLCVFDQQPMPYKGKVTESQSWGDIPTCKEQGLDVDYLMLRGIFMAGGVTPDQVAYYVGVLKKVQGTPEWKQLMDQGAFNTTSLEGKEYADWVAKEEQRHIALMKAAGFISGQK